MRSAVGIPLLPAQAVAKGQGGGGCQLNCSELVQIEDSQVLNVLEDQITDCFLELTDIPVKVLDEVLA